MATEDGYPETIVLLDLEETVIDDWSNGLFIERNLDKIDEFLNGHHAQYTEDIGNTIPPIRDLQLGVMSWAISDDRDLVRFANRFQPYLEQRLKREFDPSLVLSMTDYAKMVFECSGMQASVGDMYDMFKKEEVLLRLARKHPRFEHKNVFLIDDAVDHHLLFKAPASRCYVEFRNIESMHLSKEQP